MNLKVASLRSAALPQYAALRIKVIESPRRHPKKRNGPVPIGCTALVAADCGDTMTKAPQARDCSRPPDRCLTRIPPVKGSTMTTARIFAKRDFCGFTDADARTLSSEYLATAASN